MSLRDIFKEKPPVVSTCSTTAWPAPAKSVSVSSSNQPSPYLTSSPLYSFKRRPSLREFLNPNYNQKHHVGDNEEISEASVLLSNIKGTGLSKADLELQTCRVKTAKPAPKIKKNTRKSTDT